MSGWEARPRRRRIPLVWGARLWASWARLRPVGAVAIGLACLATPCRAQRRPRITDVQVAPSQVQLKVGASQPLQATAYDAVGNPSLTAVFAWSSSDSRVATVDRDGTVTGVAAGTAVISARTRAGATAKSARATITVVAGLTPPVAQRESARVGVAAAKPDSSPRVTVPPSNPAVPPLRDLAAPGARTATVPGSAALAKQPEGMGTPDSLLVEPRSVRLTRRGSQQLAYRAIRANRQNAEKVPIVFTVDSGGDRIVRVDSVGLMTAVGSPGRAIVRAVVPGDRRIPAVAVAVEVAGDSVVAPVVVAPPVAVPSAAKGFLTVNATPYATVSIDGVEMGDTPLVRFALTPGDHTVRLVHDGYRTQQFPVKIEAVNELRVNKVLLREN